MADLRLRRGWQEPDDLEEILAQMVEAAAAIAEVVTGRMLAVAL